MTAAQTRDQHSLGSISLQSSTQARLQSCVQFPERKGACQVPLPEPAHSQCQAAAECRLAPRPSGPRLESDPQEAVAQPRERPGELRKPRLALPYGFLPGQEHALLAALHPPKTEQPDLLPGIKLKGNK